MAPLVPPNGHNQLDAIYNEVKNLSSGHNEVLRRLDRMEEAQKGHNELLVYRVTAVEKKHESLVSKFTGLAMAFITAIVIGAANIVSGNIFQK